MEKENFHAWFCPSQGVFKFPGSTAAADHSVTVKQIEYWACDLNASPYNLPQF